MHVGGPAGCRPPELERPDSEVAAAARGWEKATGRAADCRVRARAPVKKASALDRIRMHVRVFLLTLVPAAPDKEPMQHPPFPAYPFRAAAPSHFQASDPPAATRRRARAVLRRALTSD